MDELTPICQMKDLPLGGSTTCRRESLELSLMSVMIPPHGTKRIQPARGWCATVKRDCANCIHLMLPLRRPGPPAFLGGSESCDPAAWLAERHLLAGDIESNPGPTPTLKTLLHTLTQWVVHVVQVFCLVQVTC